jgi:bisphosphoglycerate-dependent phosphoglycerate mutase
MLTRESSIISTIYCINDPDMKIVQPSTLIATVVAVMAFGYWKEVIAPRLLEGQRVLIVAHANTIRALVKAVDTA